MMQWKVLGTMVTDCEEKVDGMKSICTIGGDFIGFVMPAYATMITDAPMMRETLDTLREAIRLNEADMKPGIFNYLNHILDRSPAEQPSQERQPLRERPQNAVKIALKVTDVFRNISYIKIRHNGCVSLVGANGTPFALSNIAENATELAMALEEAGTTEEALLVAQRYCRRVQIEPYK